MPAGGLVVCMENCTGLKPILEDVDEAIPRDGGLPSWGDADGVGRCMHRALEVALGVPVRVCPQPQYTGALGAALLAACEGLRWSIRGSRV